VYFFILLCKDYRKEGRFFDEIIKNRNWEYSTIEALDWRVTFRLVFAIDRPKTIKKV